MRIALDTNRYSDLFGGNAAMIEVVENAEKVWLPFVVVAELRAGFAAGTHQASNEGILRRFLLKPRVEVLYPDDQTTHHYAAIYRQLRAQGTPIPVNDIWIGALVLQHSLTLLTRDAHFERLPQIARA